MMVLFFNIFSEEPISLKESSILARSQTRNKDVKTGSIPIPEEIFY